MYLTTNGLSLGISVFLFYFCKDCAMNEEVCYGNTLSLSLIAKIQMNLPFTLVKLVELHHHATIG